MPSCPALQTLQPPAEAAAAAPKAADPLALDNFALSEPVKSLLRAKGIEALFAIQAQCLPPVLGGKDLVGRARTGCGKTLAFVLPIVELLSKDNGSAVGGRRPFGRPPSVVVLAPTRELAKQVGFASVEGLAMPLQSCLAPGVCFLARTSLFPGGSAAQRQQCGLLPALEPGGGGALSCAQLAGSARGCL
jgi:hypothetical protein